VDKASPEDIFDEIDRDDSGDIDGQEGFNALYCMVEWGLMEEDDARFLFHYLGGAAGADGKLNKEEARAAIEDLHTHSSDEGGEEEPYGGPVVDCS